MDNMTFTKRVFFIGVPDMALVTLESLRSAGVNIVGVMGPERTHNTFGGFKNFVLARGLTFLEYTTLSEAVLLNSIKALKPDIAVVCSFNLKIPKVLIDLFPGGIVNVHPSLLPKYRGGNPYSRVIENGETKTGVTIHFISEEFDRGDIIAQEVCEVAPYETMGTIFDKTNEIACKLLLKVLFYYEKHNTLPRKKQPEGDFPKALNYKNDEMFVDYNRTADEIERFVRALNPYISAMTVFRKQIVKLHKVSVHDIKGVDLYQNGAICMIEGDKIYIKTAGGCICPEVIQYAGAFIGDCHDFIKLEEPKLGEKFSNGHT